MPIKTVSAPTGEELSFWVREGATDEEILRQAPIAWGLAQQGVDVTEPPRGKKSLLGYPVEAAKGVAGGVLGLIESAATGAAQLLPEESEQAVRAGIAELGERFQAPFEPAPAYEDSVTSKFSRALGSTVPFLAMGPFGAAGLAGGVGLGVAAGAGEAIQRAEAQGATEEEISQAGRLGTIPGALEFAAPARIIGRARRVLGPAGDEVGRELSETIFTKLAARGNMLGDTRLGRIGQAAIDEATQEAIAEVGQNLIARGVYDPEQGVFAGVGESAALGGGVGGLLELIIGRRGRRPETPQPQPEPEPEPPFEPAGLLGGPPPPGLPAPGDPMEGPAIPMPPPEDYTPPQPPMGPDRDTEMRQYRAAERARAAAQPQQELFPELSAIDAVVAQQPEAGRATTNAGVLAELGLTMDEVMPMGTITAEQERQWLRSPPDPEQVRVLERISADRVAPPVSPEQVSLEAVIAANEQYDRGVAEQAAQQEAFETAERQQTEQRDVEERMANMRIETPSNPAMQQAMINALRNRRPAAQEAAPAVAPEPAPAPAPAPEAAPAAVPEPAPEAGLEPEGTFMGELQRETSRNPMDERSRIYPIEDGTVEGARVSVEVQPYGDGVWLSDINAVDKPRAGNSTEALGWLKAIADRTNTPISLSPKAYSTDPNKIQSDERLAQWYEDNGWVKQPDSEVLTYYPQGATPAPAPAPEAAPEPAPAPEAAPTTARVPEAEIQVDRYREADPAWMRDMVQNAAPVAPADEAIVRDLRRRTAGQPVKARYGDIKTPEEAAAYYFNQFPTAVALRTMAAEANASTDPTYVDDTRSMEKAANLGIGWVTDPANGFSEQALTALQTQSTTFGKMVGKVRTPQRAAVPPEPDTETDTDIETDTEVDVEPTRRQTRAAARSVGFSEDTERRFEKKYGNFYNPASVAKLIKSGEITVEQLDRGPDDPEIVKATQRIRGLPEYAVEASMLEADSNVKAAIAKGNIKDAIGYITDHPNPVIAEIARKIEPWLDNTKLEVVDSLTNPETGENLSGEFIPRRNTIRLNSSLPTSVHTILHEAAHAATINALVNNKSHPSVKQLQRLYEKVKGRLDNQYAAQSLEEFVAEAFVNPKFQNELSRLTFYDANVGSKPIQALKQLFNAIRKLFGWNANRIADENISSILSPAPDFVNAGPLYMSLSGGKYGDMLNSTWTGGQGFASPSSVKKAAKDIKINWEQSWSRKPIQAVLDTLSLPNLVDLIKDKVPAAEKFYREFQLQDGVRVKMVDEVQRNAKNYWEAFKPTKFTKDKVALTEMENFVEETTRLEVDPTKPYGHYSANPEKDRAHKRLRNKYLSNTFTDSQRKVYTGMRDHYAKVYDTLMEALDTRLEATFKDSDVQLLNNVRNRIQRELVKGRIEPYFPLDRQGEFWVNYKMMIDGVEQSASSAFESPAQAQEFIDQVLAADKDYVQDSASTMQVADMVNRYKKNWDNLPSTSFLYDLYKMPELRNNTAKRDEILNLLIDTMPEQVLLKSFRKREGTIGARKDFIKVYTERMPLLINSIANVQHQPKLAEYAIDIEQEADKHKDNQLVQQIKTAMVGTPDETAKNLFGIKSYYEFSKNPYVHKAARNIKAAAFGMTLGGNISGGVVNLTNLPIVVQSYLGGIYGYPQTAGTMMRATKMFMGSGFSRPSVDLDGNAMRQPSGPSITNYDYDNPPADKAELLKRLRPLADLLKLTGLDQRTLVGYQAELDNPSNSIFRKVNSVLGFVMSQSERMNRQVTGLTAYMLEMETLASKKHGRKVKFDNISDADIAEFGEQAANLALHALEHTNSSALLTTAPRIAQTDIGSVAFLYRRYPSAMMFMQGRMFNALIGRRVSELAPDDVKGREEIRSLRRGLAFLYLNSAVLAGVGGVPLYSIAQKLYDAWVADDEEDFDTIVAQKFKEPYYSGLLSTVTGFSMADRIAQNDFIWRYQRNYQPESWVESMVEFAGGPALGIMTRFGRGLGMVFEGGQETRRGLEQMAPAFLGNIAKGVRYMGEGDVLSMRGDPILEDIETNELAGQFIGFAPLRYTQQLARNAVIKRIDNAVIERQTKLLRRYYNAVRNGDSEGALEAMEDIMAHSLRHPEAAISKDTIDRSMRQHQSTSALAKAMGGITVSRRRMVQSMMTAAEFE